MFPLEYPARILRRYKNQPRIVLDPFCGRGTTLFASRQMNFETWGIDSSPVAVAIARAKLATCTSEEVLALGAKLIDQTVPKQIPSAEFFRVAFNSETLVQLCCLREGLLGLRRASNAATILRAAALGCLHGPVAKNVSGTGYFSNQMPRTYASKPAYAVRYWRNHKLVAPRVSVLRVLERKISRFTGLSESSPSSIDNVVVGDSRRKNTFRPIRKGVNLVITSPPYLGMRTYVQDQWLRNWFLGGSEEVDYTPGIQLGQISQDAFVRSLAKVWTNVAARAGEDLHMYVRIGIIQSAKANAKALFRSSLEESGAIWREVSVRSAETASAGKRQAGQMKANSEPAVEFDFHVVRV